ncbi:TetR family transcriptional regulator [Nocardia sp. NPDC020380]|uniref:TetR family transcriptional regulator n=1 Tax=Nocardia sp. NPDC020380 TaxID=3364309 RepID=UPI0037B6F555
MPRWEPNARERLMRAALTLFAERGYENTTVIDIVERAGLGKTTFFRYFRDKREVLFGGDSRVDLLGTEIAAAPPSATPLEALAAALTAAGKERFTSERRETLTLRQAVIDANPELLEREALKNLTLVTSMTTALEKRGVSGLTASVIAQLGALTIDITYKRWIDPANTEDFTTLVERTLTEVRAAAAA